MNSKFQLTTDTQSTADFWTQGATTMLATPASLSGGSGSKTAAPSKQSPMKKAHRLLRGRYPLAIGLAIVTGAVCATAGFLLVPPKYESSGMIAINPIVVKPGPEDGVISQLQMFMQGQFGYLTSTPVAVKAMEDKDFVKAWRAAYPSKPPVVADFITAIDVEHVKNGPLIKVTFSDKNKTVAQTGAHALISAYYKLHGNGDDAQEVEDKVAFLTNRIADQDRILLQAKRQLELLAKQAGTTDLTTRDNAIQGKLTDAEGQYYNARNAYEAAVSAANGKQVAVKPDKEFVYAQIAAADHLMQIKLSNRDDARSELRDLSVQFGPNSTVFKRAQMRLNDTEDAVNAYATRFLASNQGRMDLQLEGGSDAGNLDALKRTSEHLAKMVDDYRQQAAETSSEHQHMDELKARIENATAQRDTDQKTIDDVQAKMALTKPVNIVSYGDEATLSGDKRKIVAAVGFLFGGFIPVGLIMLYGMVENRFRFSDDATGTDLAGVTLLGILPNLPDRLSDPQQAGIAAHCVHQIRTMLQISRINDEPQVVAITSASTGDGKTSLTLALGLSYAACGARALLIDCDLLAAGLTHRLNVNSADGVLEAVANRALLEYVRTTDIADVAILPVGTTHSHHASTLSPVSLRRLLSEAKKNFDIIIVDTGPILGSIEASLVCAAADRTILAIARNQQRPLVEKSIEHLQAIGAHLAGVVFNRAHARDFEQSMSGVGLRSRTALAKSKDAA